MRAFVAVAVCFQIFLSASLQAGKFQTVKSAPERWAADGSGGNPDFIRHIVPLFSKLGCNMRSCHGSFQGQNGFQLSLFGFEPEPDHKGLLEIDEESEGEGPRVNIKSPADSLFLLKPIATDDSHGGGKRMELNSWEYRIFHQWIADGARYDPKKTIKVTQLKLDPPEIIFNDRKQKSNIRAIAFFEDGTQEDVTGLTVFSSNDESVAVVSKDGEVTVSRTGDTAIIARYSGGVTSTQVLVPAPDDGTPAPTVFPHNKIDEFVISKLNKLRIRPSDLCSDADFIRRTYLDVIGALPTSDQTRISSPTAHPTNVQN